ncbi:Uncharacterised protein [Trueperella pyogenes]|nr:Uncharacterised protein [Trueperella pyogenes]
MSEQFPIVMRGYDRAQVDERVAQLEKQPRAKPGTTSHASTHRFSNCLPSSPKPKTLSKKTSARLTPASAHVWSASCVLPKSRRLTS